MLVLPHVPNIACNIGAACLAGNLAAPSPFRLNPACARAQAAFAGKGNKAFDNGVASTAGAFDNILMNGQEVFKFAVRAVPTVRSLLGRLRMRYCKLHQ